MAMRRWRVANAEEELEWRENETGVNVGWVINDCVKCVFGAPGERCFGRGGKGERDPTPVGPGCIGSPIYCMIGCHRERERGGRENKKAGGCEGFEMTEIKRKRHDEL